MRSLTLRLALLSGVWVAAGLGAAAWFVAGVVTRQVESAFETRLGALLDAAVAATAIDAEERVVVTRAPAGADFERPLSGAYWQVTAPDGAVATSRSLWDQVLPAAAVGHDGVLLRDAPGPRGEALRIAERDVVPAGASGTTHVAVALSRRETEAEVARLRGVLAAVFAVLGTGLVVGVVLQVVAGLAPLRRARRALAEVRAGRREALDLPAPAEIAPLVAEIDALVAQNRATVERARAHVGNLAHALKTPVAVLRNALDATPPDIAEIRARADELERLVQHHLARARAAATAGGLAAEEAAPVAVAGEIAAALRRLPSSRAVAIAVAGDPSLRVRVGRQDLAEMLGNLMENACKWAAARVEVAVAAPRPGRVAILVRDDGPGLAADHAAVALARGGRLDEAQPGSGLGLAIVADLAAAHGGTLALERAPQGGLQARLELPGAARRAAAA
ncbi:MAG: HAMP domain-containing histidine kinase [Alphaproteobacteria bacterium]|nr:HAMP domain-containing histidine kinase [Alphaproteobacteria bacterium]